MANVEVVKLITNEGLREKIAKWLGWEFHVDGVHWRVSSDVLGWKMLENLPDFPNDIRACFDYIAPELFGVDILKLNRYEGEFQTAYRVKVRLPSAGWFVALDKSLPLAFCSAVDKLID